jgi:hypothetical protein
MIVEFMTIEEARAYLAISHRKMNKLINDRLLKTVPDTLKTGIILVKKEDVDNLKMQLK